MSLLQQITTGAHPKPPRLLLYGVDGIGKTSTAANAPNAIFIPTEEGVGEYDVASFPLCKSLADVENAISALVNEDHKYKTLVLDTADWLEWLVWEKLCSDYNVKGIEKVDGGYSKGYKHALGYWRHILDGLDVLRDKKGMAIILLAHAKVEKFEDPETTAYDRYSPRMHKDASAMLREWVDAVLFATRKIITKTEDAGFNKKRTTAAGLGANGGDRILRCEGSPACLAKNRFNLPPELPLSWQALEDAIKAGRKKTPQNK